MGKFTKKFTEEQERAILSIYFTNPHGNVSFIRQTRDFGPEEQAALAAKYSRSDRGYQAQFLAQVEKDPNLDIAFIDAAVADPSLIERRFGLGVTSLRKDADRFHNQWSLGFTPEEKDDAVRHFGDDSIKDGANVAYHTENITGLDNQVITMNPRNRPQVVSTRYIDRGKVLDHASNNPDIKASRHSGEILRVLEMLGDAYTRFTDISADYIRDHPTNLRFRDEAWLSKEVIEADLEKWKRVELKKDEERTFTDAELDVKRKDIYVKREKEYPAYARKTVFDFTRYFLTPGIPTMMGVITDARTLEEDLTNLLSSPLLSTQQLAHELMREGRKVLPVLLDPAKTHARKSDFIVNMRTELSDFVRTQVEAERTKNFARTNRVKLVDVPSYNDAQLAAATVYPYSNCSMEQLYDHFATNHQNIKHIVDTILRLRGKFDADPPELLHGGFMKETLIDLGADRDLQRHRRLFKTRQLLTTYHGYEMPQLFPEAVLDKEFSAIMDEVDRTYRVIADDNPYVAQLMVPFAFKVRRLYSSQFGQDLFMTKLRSGEGGIISYRIAMWDLADADQATAPEFARLLRVNRTTYPPHLIGLKEAKAWYNASKK